MILAGRIRPLYSFADVDGTQKLMGGLRGLRGGMALRGERLKCSAGANAGYLHQVRVGTNITR